MTPKAKVDGPTIAMTTGSPVPPGPAAASVRIQAIVTFRVGTFVSSQYVVWAIDGVLRGDVGMFNDHPRPPAPVI